jgi:putative oxygen-independent coproporphyrinogen III oxidase
VGAGAGREESFVPVLVDEINWTLGNRPNGTRLHTVFFGGGTPSLLSEDSWKKLFGAMTPYLGPAGNIEITCELNPEDVCARLLDFLAGLGINRVSLGVQSLDPEAQTLLGRCSPEKNHKALERVLERFSNVSVDVLLGVPGRTMASLHDTVEGLVGYEPPHFSVYCLEPGGDVSGGADRFWAGVDSEVSADEFLMVSEYLRSAGYDHYEVSNFASPGYECRHNRTYWDGGDYVGVGPAAHSCIDGKRFYNRASLSDYTEGDWESRRIYDERSRADLETERVMLGLRTSRGLSLESLRCPQGVLDGIFEEGLATVTGNRIRLTDRGYLLLNEVVLRLLVD